MRQKKEISRLFSTDPDTLLRYNHDSVYEGHPDSVYVARDWQEVQEVIAYCHGCRLPVTFCGSQTSMTGASVANEGLALSLAGKNRILDIGTDHSGTPFVVTEPGVILGDLKKEVARQGYLYPPDPTSYNEVQVGATIATNATGEDTFKYGPTRRYVDELEVILPDGSVKTITRQKPVPHSVVKNTAGYYLDGGEIDEVIGSEGTLCLIKKIKLKLLRLKKDKTFVLVLPFSSFKNCIRAVPLIAGKSKGVTPRSIELVGPGAVAYFQRCPVCPPELKKEKSFLYIKDEYEDEADLEKTLARWFDELNRIYGALGDKPCLERVFLAKTDRQLRDIHECRHFVPLTVNEAYFKYNALGGGKVGTDWWVPLKHLEAMMMKTYREACELKIPFLVFSHIGNGHPHWNFLTRDAQEKRRAVAFVKRQCRAAVRYGGGVAGEHGIGKTKRDTMTIQHAPNVIARMREIKRRWDPLWLFGRDNILEYKEAFS